MNDDVYPLECRAGSFHGIWDTYHVLQPAVYRGDRVVRVDIEADIRAERDAVGTSASVGDVEFSGVVYRGSLGTLLDIRLRLLWGTPVGDSFAYPGTTRGRIRVFGLPGDGESRRGGRVDRGVGDLFPDHGREYYPDTRCRGTGAAFGGLFYPIGESRQLGDRGYRDKRSVGFRFRTGGRLAPASGTAVRGVGVFGYFRGEYVTLPPGGAATLPGNILGRNARGGIQCPLPAGVPEGTPSPFRGTNVAGLGTDIEYPVYISGSRFHPV